MSEVVVWADLLHIDTVTGATEDQTGFHCLGESFGLLVSWNSRNDAGSGLSKMAYLNGNLLLVLAREIHKMVVFSPD